MKEYILQLPSFEGPLDLLLHFVRTRNVDIRHILIAPICHDYLEFLRTCKEIDITLSSEWLAMTARLLYIKSCALLPARELDEAPGSESIWYDIEDPKAQLIRELLDRQRLLAIRRALPKLQALETKELATYTRGYLGEIERNRTFELGEISVFDLLGFCRQALARQKKSHTMEITVRHLRLSDVIRDILTHRLPRGTKKLFMHLLPLRWNLHQLIMTFLAVLELAKNGRVKLEQRDPFDNLEIERVK